MSGPRNRYGVNDAADCHRTVNGVVYQAWGSCVAAALIAQYRSAGLRCRRFGEELFIHPDDKAKAIEIDKAFSTQPPKGERTPDKPGFELSPEVIALVDEQSQYFVDHIQRRDRNWTEGMDVFRSRHD